MVVWGGVLRPCASRRLSRFGPGPGYEEDMNFEVLVMGDGGEVGVRGAGRAEGRKKNDFLDECLWPWATSAIVDRQTHSAQRVVIVKGEGCQGASTRREGGYEDGWKKERMKGEKAGGPDVDCE